MEYLLHLAIYLTIYSILGLSLNLIVGYTGLFAITHAAFYGLGAYSTALLTTKLGANFFLTVFAGVLVTSFVSLLIGIVLSRFSEDYYSIVSIGFCVIAYGIYMNWYEVTNGVLGIIRIPRPSIGDFVLTSKLQFLSLSLISLAAVYFLCRSIVRSSFGRALMAIREDEKTIEVYGYRTVYYKLAVFTIGSMMAAIAGSLFASYLAFIGASMFTLNESIFVLVIIIMGGLASLRGSLLGAGIMILLPEILRFVGLPNTIAAQARQTIYGVTLILLMLYRPQGLLGEYKL